MSKARNVVHLLDNEGHRVNAGRVPWPFKAMPNVGDDVQHEGGLYVVTRILWHVEEGWADIFTEAVR